MMATITKRSAGNWKADVRKDGIRKSKTFRTKAMAQQWSTQTEDQIATRTLPRQHKDARLVDILSQYEQEITPTKRSHKSESIRLRQMREYFGSTVTLSGLEPEAIVGYAQYRLKSMKSDTVRKDMGTLGHVIRAAMALGWATLPSNPVTAAREIITFRKLFKPSQERITRILPDTEHQLLNQCNESFSEVVRFAIETGMRRGELVNAQHSHINKHVDCWTLTIPISKTDIVRTIPLSPKAIEIIESLDQTSSEEYLFGYSDPTSLTTAFARACKRAGLTGIRFHDLRHEAISRWFELGLQVQEVASMTGHTNYKTLKRYVHVLPSTVSMKLRTL